MSIAGTVHLPYSSSILTIQSAWWEEDLKIYCLKFREKKKSLVLLELYF